MAQIIEISKLNEESTNWEICGTVSQKSPLKDFKNGKWFCFVLTDKTTEICVKAFDETFYKQIENEKLIYVSEAVIEKAKKVILTNNTYEIILNKNSIIREEATRPGSSDDMEASINKEEVSLKDALQLTEKEIQDSVVARDDDQAKLARIEQTIKEDTERLDKLKAQHKEELSRFSTLNKNIKIKRLVARHIKFEIEKTEEGKKANEGDKDEK